MKNPVQNRYFCTGDPIFGHVVKMRYFPLYRKNVPKCAKMLQNALKCAKMRENALKSANIFQNALKCAKMIHDERACAKMR